MITHEDKIIVAVLESDNNLKGDLFGRAMQDLFHALGYQDFTLNIAKAGREIDIKGKHRTEKRTLLAECKATKGAIGGSDVNKFAGAVEVERIRSLGTQTAAYYVSLGGFTAPAIEQEEEAGNRLVLLDSSRVVEELVRGRVIVDREMAAATASRALALPSRAALGEKRALLLHEIGWIWAFFFKSSGKYTHFALVHADGSGLDSDLAAEVIAADADSARLFIELKAVSTFEPEIGGADFEEAAKADYFAYLEREFGGITLEGLPADQEVGSKTIRLESLYVPLHLTPVSKPKTSVESESSGDGEDLSSGLTRATVTDVLMEHRHVAILAAPGGGKTTLLKRLAVAYAAADRRGEVADELPAEDWFPLFIRCRQLGESIRRPITELIRLLPKFAELADLEAPFLSAALGALKAGKVLLLVDGLDEISDPGDRSAFAAQLRTFIGTYPAARVVVTSREAGFRAVSGAMSSACSLYKISDLSTDDIHTLCRTWQHEVGGGSSSKAATISESIVSKPRVRDLAINPLLLTILLLVQRWFGELPPKRSVLYEKAIEVLLMTWNTEGHTPIDQDEAMPQLAYAAFSMMKTKKQNVSAKVLKDLFDEARAAMPEVLGYARMSSTEFIERVEDRSSLIVQSGHVIEDGQIRPLYEFKHLTFQEYLAAKACVESWNPMRDTTEDYAEVLDGYLTNESWVEVVPLAGVLAGSRGAKRIVDRLITRLEVQNDITDPWFVRLDTENVTLCRSLIQCLADEVQISPDQVRRAIDCAIRSTGAFTRLVADISMSKFASELPEVIWAGYCRHNEYLARYADALASYSLWHVRESQDQTTAIKLLLQSDSKFDRVVGAAAAMITFYSMDSYEMFNTDDTPEERSPYTSHVAKSRLPEEGECQILRSLLVNSLASEDLGSPPYSFTVIWAIAWLGERVVWPDDELVATISALLKIWRESSDHAYARMAAWAMWRIPLTPIELNFSIPREPGLRDFLLAASRRKGGSSHQFDSDLFRAAKIISHYTGYKILYREKLSEIDMRRDRHNELWLGKLSEMEARSRPSV